MTTKIASNQTNGVEVSVLDFGPTLDNSTDNTAIVQLAIDSINTDADQGGIVRIPRFCNFNLKNLTFNKRQTLIYFIGDDVSTTPSSNLNTNELVTFQANANNAGIVNEQRLEAPFHPGYVVDVRKDVTGHTAFLGGSQTQDNPARASYNIADEELDIWRAVWQNYNTATNFSGMTMHSWVHRITITGITDASFSTVPTKGTIITGTTSGAIGRLFSIDGTNMLLTWVSGTFESGETVSDDDETTTATITTATRSSLVGTSIGWGLQEAEILIGLPTNMTNRGETLNVGGKVAATNTITFGQILPETITSPGFVWVDSWNNATPAGLEVLMDTTVTAGRERLSLHKLNATAKIGHVGAVRAHTNFSNSVLNATTNYNVTSLVRNGVGDYTITFTEPFDRADYTVSFAKSNPTDNPVIYVLAINTLRIRNYDIGTGTTLQDLAGSLHVTCVGGDF